MRLRVAQTLDLNGELVRARALCAAAEIASATISSAIRQIMTRIRLMDNAPVKILLLIIASSNK